MYPLVYISGKYRDKTPEDINNNVDTALQYAAIVLKDLNALPIIPHSSYHGLQSIISEMQDEFISMRCELVSKCDALLILPESEESLGTSLEIATALRCNIPICHTIEELEKALTEYFNI